MLRLIACMLAGMLAALPASAQTLQRASAQTMELSATTMTADRAVQMSRADVSMPSQTAQSHAGRFAAAVFRVLASQNTINLDGPSPTEMDAVLRPPAWNASGGTSLFSAAKRLYDTATSYKSERAVLKVDPLSLKCRLSVNLSSFGSKK